MTNRTWRVFLLLPFAFVIACGGKPADPVSFVKEFNALKSRHRIEAALEFLSEDCVLEKTGARKLEGKAKIREYYEYERALRTELSFSDFRLTPGAPPVVVSSRAYERNDFQRAAGLPEYVYASWDFTIANGRIKKMVATRTEDTARAISDFNFFFQGWLNTRPEELKKLLDPDKKAIFSRETAEIIVRLVKEYSSSLTVIKGA